MTLVFILMPSYSRPSPSAVIHDWLSRTEIGPPAEKHASLSKKKRTSQVKRHQHRLRNVENNILPLGSPCKRIESLDGDRVLRETGEQYHAPSHICMLMLRQENIHLPSGFEHDTCQLAQRLGLRTPFRTLDNNQEQVHAKEDAGIHIVKRKRSLSPPSPHPSPKDRRRSLAEADDREDLICPRPTEQAIEFERSIATSPFHLPRPVTAAPNSSRTVPRPYERKPRRKTREDHYTLKETFKASKQTIDEGESLVRKKGKRKRREKLGSALMHDFTASNVAFSRLTVSPSLKDISDLGLKA